MGHDALTAYRGDTVIYIGESDGGCCGDDQLHAGLASGWQVDVECDTHAFWSGMHDVCVAYRRR
jgi:hypothetical protein